MLLFRRAVRQRGGRVDRRGAAAHQRHPRSRGGVLDPAPALCWLWAGSGRRPCQGRGPSRACMPFQEGHLSPSSACAACMRGTGCMQCTIIHANGMLHTHRRAWFRVSAQRCTRGGGRQGWGPGCFPMPLGLGSGLVPCRPWPGRHIGGMYIWQGAACGLRPT